ncbi:hypothetical protein GIX51_10210, partial [Lactobacillus reuteri]|nr:hypothetical protein [Limosilactobacillus reuteri]
DSVAMLKRSSKVYYRYRGRAYSIKALYLRLLHSKRVLHECFGGLKN